MKNKKKLIFLSIIQFILLLALLGNIMYFNQTADTFKIESRSLDPIEPLYGHYAALSYEFDDITEDQWKGEKKPKEGSKAYLVLKKGSNGLYEFDYATDKRPKNAKYIKATINYVYISDEYYDKQIIFSHNLDRYYIPESQMEEFNRATDTYIVTLQNNKDLTVIKSVEIKK